MSDTKISALPAFSSVGDADIFPGDPAGAAPTSKATAAQIKTYTSASPTLVTPNLGTPSAGVLTNATGLPEGGLALTDITTNNVGITKHGFAPKAPNDATKYLDGTGAYTVPAGGAANPGGSTTQVQYNNAGAFGGITGATTNGTALTLVAPVLGTPASATLTNATGLPIGSGVSGLGTGVGTFLATPSSANLAAAVTDETGSGALVFGTSPTLVTPALGTPASGVATNLTGTASGLTSGITNALKSASTTVDVSAATAPTANQVLTATDGTHATWQTPGAGSGTVTHTGALTANAIVLGNASADITALGSLGTTTTVLHGNAAGAPTFGAVNLATDVTGVIPTAINAQTGTSYTVVAGDQGKEVTLSNASAVAVTLPQATGSFTTGWGTTLLNLGAGLVTITPTTSTVNGAATVVLATGQSYSPVSDGTNYQGTFGARTANALRSATTIVDTSAATAPTNGQVLTATGGTAANWQTPAGGGSVVPGLIVGCNPIWTSATQLSIGSGQLYIESTNTVIAVAASTITPSSPSSNTWYHGYVNNSGTFSVATTAPVAFATPCGFARSKTSDTSNRYVGSFRTDGSGNFYQFTCTQNGLFTWKGQNIGSSPFRVVTNGSATSSTNVDCSAVVPVTSSSIYLGAYNSVATGVFAYFSPGDYTVSSTKYEWFCGPGTAAGGQTMVAFLSCDASQTINYINSAVAGGTYIDVIGFQLQR